MEKVNKKIGFGSLSLLLCVLGILFCIPDAYNGIPYAVIYSLIFFIASLIVGHKFQEDFGAKVGEMGSLIILFLFLPLMLF